MLLPEMPFFPWIAATIPMELGKWETAVEEHERWKGRLIDLAPANVLGTRPTARRRNEAFFWSSTSGYQPVHDKYYLPDEEGFWEATWYERGDLSFAAVEVGRIKAGFAICTELWFTEHAREYARQGIQVLVCPRATEMSTVDKWIAGGRVAAVMSGAFCISSNRSGEGSGIHWGGAGWVIDPDGNVLGVTSNAEPYLTLEVEPVQADRAKKTYPRYVSE